MPEGTGGRVTGLRDRSGGLTTFVLSAEAFWQAEDHEPSVNVQLIFCPAWRRSTTHHEFLSVVRNNYANFSGRARRREFWMFTLIHSLIGAALYLLFVLNSGLFSEKSEMFPPLGIVFLALLVIYGLATLLPTTAVTVRQLHDAGFSGWMYLLSVVGLSIVGLSIVVLVLTILDSRPGSNRWGPNPKDIQAPVNSF